MFNLQIKNGVSLGKTHLNDKRRREFIEAIAAVMKREQEDVINNAWLQLFTLVVDGGTDSSKKDLEIIHIRMLCDGQAVNRFLTIVELPNRTAYGVIQTFEMAMERVGGND